MKQMIFSPQFILNTDSGDMTSFSTRMNMNMKVTF